MKIVVRVLLYTFTWFSKYSCISVINTQYNIIVSRFTAWWHEVVYVYNLSASSVFQTQWLVYRHQHVIQKSKSEIDLLKRHPSFSTCPIKINALIKFFWKRFNERHSPITCAVNKLFAKKKWTYLPPCWQTKKNIRKKNKGTLRAFNLNPEGPLYVCVIQGPRKVKLNALILTERLSTLEPFAK